MRRALLVLALLGATGARAGAEPSTGKLVAIGVGLALPDYLLGVTLHEGSHALAAELTGATVDELHLFPPGQDPHVHTFRFGWTYVHGLTSDPQRAVFYIAPKITDALLIGGYAALAYTSAWPGNRYGSLALTVFGTGLWVDFTKDLFLFAPTNDIEQFFRVTGLQGWRGELAARAVYAIGVAGLGYLVYRGYEHTFDPPATSAAARSPVVLPVLQAAF